jgi:hypothetical protein
MVNHDPPFSVKETSKLRGLSRKRVYVLIHEGCPTVRIGRQHYIYPDTLDNFLRNREVPGCKEPAKGRGRPKKYGENKN